MCTAAAAAAVVTSGGRCEEGLVLPDGELRAGDHGGRRSVAPSRRAAAPSVPGGPPLTARPYSRQSAQRVAHQNRQGKPLACSYARAPPRPSDRTVAPRKARQTEKKTERLGRRGKGRPGRVHILRAETTRIPSAGPHLGVIAPLDAEGGSAPPPAVVPCQCAPNRVVNPEFAHAYTVRRGHQRNAS